MENWCEHLLNQLFHRGVNRCEMPFKFFGRALYLLKRPYVARMIVSPK